MRVSTLRGRHRPLSAEAGAPNPWQACRQAATRARRTRMVGSRPTRTAGGSGRARNAIFAQGPSGQAPKGMPCERRSGPARPTVGVRAGRARLAVPAGCRMRFPCKDPMERRVDQKGRNGRGSARTAGLAGVAEHGMRFRAATLCNGEPGTGAGLDGRGSHRMARLAVVRGTESVFPTRTLWTGRRVSRAGMVGVPTSRRGWRWRTSECDFRAKTLWTGGRVSRTGRVRVRTGWRGYRGRVGRQPPTGRDARAVEAIRRTPTR